jgi:tRNA(Ile2) C34 agmatinyltransferase TiaS
MIGLMNEKSIRNKSKGVAMNFRCGQCRHFTRTRDNQKDLCEAWEQPTMADRQACPSFIPRKLTMTNKDGD